MHLPLKPIGLHSDFEGDSSGAPSPVGSHSASLSANDEATVAAPHRTIDSADGADLSMPGSAETPITADSKDGKKTIDDNDDKGNSDKNGKDDEDDEGGRSKNTHSWLSWFKEKFRNVKDWVKNKIHEKESDGDG